MDKIICCSDPEQFILFHIWVYMGDESFVILLSRSRMIGFDCTWEGERAVMGQTLEGESIHILHVRRTRKKAKGW